MEPVGFGMLIGKTLGGAISPQRIEQFYFERFPFTVAVSAEFHEWFFRRTAL